MLWRVGSSPLFGGLFSRRGILSFSRSLRLRRAICVFAMRNAPFRIAKRHVLEAETGRFAAQNDPFRISLAFSSLHDMPEMGG